MTDTQYVVIFMLCMFGVTAPFIFTLGVLYERRQRWTKTVTNCHCQKR